MGPWARPKVFASGASRAWAQAGEKTSEKSTFWENWDPRKKIILDHFCPSVPMYFFLEKRNPAKPAKIQVSG